MGVFDNVDQLAKKAKEQAAAHPDQLEKISDQVIERGGDAADSATGGRHRAQVDRAQQAADDRVGP